MTEIPLRLFFWCEAFFAVGGAQVALQRQIRELLRRGHQVTVGSMDSSGALSFDRGPEHGFEHLHLERVGDIYPVMSAPLGPPYDAMYVQRLFEGDPEAQLRALARLAPSVPTLIRVTTVGDLDQVEHLEPGRHLESVAGFVVLNEEQVHEVRRHVPGAAVVRQRNGLAPGELKPGRFAPDGPFLFLGRRSPSKGIDLLLDAWGAYRASGGARGLRIIGPEKPGRPFRRLEDPGWLDEHQVVISAGGPAPWSSVTRAFALVRPSRAEGHCNTMLEAMAAGIPVLAADIPGLAGDIRASGAGDLFTPGDAASLARALHGADARGEDMARMATLGPDFMARERTLERTVQGLVDALGGAIEGSLGR